MKLAELYAPLSKKMAVDYKVINIAFSNEEYEIFQRYSDSNIELIHFQNKKEELSHDGRNYDKEYLSDIERFIVKESKGRFNINSSINADRGSKALSREQAIDNLVDIYNFWKYIFEKYRVKYFYHETTSLMINHFACLFCRKNNAIYSDMISLPSANERSLFFVNYDDGSSIEIENKLDNRDFDKEVVDDFFLYINQRYSRPKGVSLKKDSIFKLILKSIRQEIYILKNTADNSIDKYLNNQRTFLNKIKNRIAYKRIKWDSMPSEEESYHYYSMHLEPEAVLLYWADNKYSGQVKLIENIASSLPNGEILYVKDHVLDFGYRDFNDYLQIQNISNVRLVYPLKSAVTLVKGCDSVFTVNGTVGIEALSLGKPVYTFGNVFYNSFPNVYHIKSVNDISDTITNSKEFSKESLYRYMSAYLTSLYKGNGAYFSGDNSKFSSEEEYNENIEEIFKSIKAYQKRLG
ncbi:hypothetical protein MCT05_06595 [Vibrio aestuarianus]|nr:hypothetical protein [Vibrio aestuarianus]